VIGFLREKGRKEGSDLGMNGDGTMFSLSATLDHRYHNFLRYCVVGIMQHVQFLFFASQSLIWHASTKSILFFESFVAMSIPLHEIVATAKLCRGHINFFSYGRIYVPIDDARIFLDLLWE